MVSYNRKMNVGNTFLYIWKYGCWLHLHLFLILHSGYSRSMFTECHDPNGLRISSKVNTVGTKSVSKLCKPLRLLKIKVPTTGSILIFICGINFMLSSVKYGRSLKTFFYIEEINWCFRADLDLQGRYINVFWTELHPCKFIYSLQDHSSVRNRI